MTGMTQHEQTALEAAQGTDRVTVLSTIGPLLTKVFHPDGRVDAYDDAASYKVRTVDVTGLQALGALLEQLASRPQSCIIRGKFVGKDKAVPGKVDGTWVRQNQNFDDQPLHFACIDVDGYRPGFADPVHEPAEAIADYILDCLPEPFHRASFYWQLSSSAGTKGKEGILKAHVWFWLETPYTSAQMYAWAKTIGPAVDKAVFRRVQVHYTANPVFEDGAVDPVPVRQGLCLREHEAVPLVITQAVLEEAHTAGAGSGGEDMKLVDPSEKEGLIGLFHKLYDARHVLTEFLEGFEEVTERRWTWHGGGGTPEGVWVHSDGMHIGSSHNTWPIPGIANLWDVVRVFKFEDLDRAPADLDDFEKLDYENAAVGCRPSDLAMYDWASNLPELKEYIRNERMREVDRWLQAIADADDVYVLENDVAPSIAEDGSFSVTERERLACALQGRFKEIAGVKLPIADVRKMIRPKSQASTAEDAPEWAKYWVWSADQDGFLNIETKRVISERSYNAKYDRYMARYADENGVVPRASEIALKVWDTKAVDCALYLPYADLFFTMDGVKCVNTYRADLAPPMPDRLVGEHLAAVRRVEMHAEILIPDARERRLFLDYLAYCAQNPGKKIRWAVLLKGVPGDGKTAFATMMSHILGHTNVRTLNSSTLEGSDFTSWGAGQCLVVVEEIKLHGINRHDVYNRLKPYISNDTVEIHPKGRDPFNAPNTSNQLLLTNHDDALPIDDNDRRIYFLRSPFASKEALFAAIKERTGLDHADYFDQLFDGAIKAHPGALRKWLLERELSPEFRPDGRAPATAARALAVDLAKSDDELAIMAELEAGGTGIYQDIVSTTHLLQQVKSRHDGMEVRTRRVSGILANLGFTPFARIKWNGTDCRIYLRGKYCLMEQTPHAIRGELDGLERQRKDAELEQEFKD